MRLKKSPRIGARYWIALLMASMCGTNLGDLFPDVLNIGPGVELIILVVSFAAILLIDRMMVPGSEALYWLAILVVRAAATSIADYSVGEHHQGYLAIGAGLAIVLTALVVMQSRSASKVSTYSVLPTNTIYWLTMLTAGSLGTLMGDGFGHAFSSVKVGVLTSAGIASIALIATFGIRRLGWRTVAGYWFTIVMIRWWGTNLGDILAFFTTVVVSLVITGFAMAVTLLLCARTSQNLMNNPNFMS